MNSTIVPRQGGKRRARKGDPDSRRAAAIIQREQAHAEKDLIARTHLEQSNNAWLATERHSRCDMGSCIAAGEWAIRDDDRVFCPIDAVRELAQRDEPTEIIPAIGELA